MLRCSPAAYKKPIYDTHVPPIGDGYDQNGLLKYVFIKREKLTYLPERTLFPFSIESVAIQLSANRYHTASNVTTLEDGTQIVEPGLPVDTLFCVHRAYSGFRGPQMRTWPADGIPGIGAASRETRMTYSTGVLPSH